MNKILIIGAGIHHNNGTGITLINLLSNIPKELICIVGNYDNTIQSRQNGYTNIFCLGKYRSDKDGRAMSSNDFKKISSSMLSKSFYTDKAISKLKTLKRYMVKIGLIQSASIYKFNKQLRIWLNEQKPSVIYSFGFHIPFTFKIQKYLKIPIVTHIMDDWMQTEIKKGLLAFYWQKKLDVQVRSLILRSKTLIAISDKMAREYNLRYGGNWKVFHNPIALDKWMDYQKKDYSFQETFRIAYFGRITRTNKEIINHFVDIIINRQERPRIEFHLYSDLLGKDTGTIKYHSFLPHEDIPSEMSKYDLLLLPFFFDSEWALYARLSLPTKASEYMVSGVPILLISPEDTALFEFAVENQCMFITCSIDRSEIDKTLSFIIKSEQERKAKAETAKMIAEQRFDVKKVANEFSIIFNSV